MSTAETDSSPQYDFQTHEQGFTVEVGSPQYGPNLIAHELREQHGFELGEHNGNEKYLELIGNDGTTQAVVHMAYDRTQHVGEYGDLNVELEVYNEEIPEGEERDTIAAMLHGEHVGFGPGNPAAHGFDDYLERDLADEPAEPLDTSMMDDTFNEYGGVAGGSPK